MSCFKYIDNCHLLLFMLWNWIKLTLRMYSIERNYLKNIFYQEFNSFDKHRWQLSSLKLKYAMCRDLNTCFKPKSFFTKFRNTLITTLLRVFRPSPPLLRIKKSAKDNNNKSISRKANNKIKQYEKQCGVRGRREGHSETQVNRCLLNNWFHTPYGRIPLCALRIKGNVCAAKIRQHVVGFNSL